MKKSFRAQKRWLNYKVTVAVSMLVLMILSIPQAQQRKFPPDYEKKMHAIANFEAGVVPLFVLGDLNEDGAVDQKDLELLRAYVTQKSSAGISCMAAADLDENRAVDAKDTEILEQILKKGVVKAPALSSRSRLGCDFKNFFIAARPSLLVRGWVATSRIFLLPPDPEHRPAARFPFTSLILALILRTRT